MGGYSHNGKQSPKILNKMGGVRNSVGSGLHTPTHRGSGTDGHSHEDLNGQYR